MVNSQLFVGNGNRVHFWSDSWAGNLSIKSLFPRLFSLSSEKEITLRVVMDRRDAHSDGFLRFRRTLLSWESDELIRLEAFLISVGTGFSDSADCLQWMG